MCLTRTRRASWRRAQCRRSTTCGNTPRAGVCMQEGGWNCARMLVQRGAQLASREAPPLTQAALTLPLTHLYLLARSLAHARALFTHPARSLACTAGTTCGPTVWSGWMMLMSAPTGSRSSSRAGRLQARARLAAAAQLRRAARRLCACLLSCEPCSAALAPSEQLLVIMHVKVDSQLHPALPLCKAAPLFLLIKADGICPRFIKPSLSPILSPS